jgi:hypothetical protein
MNEMLKTGLFSSEYAQMAKECQGNYNGPEYYGAQRAYHLNFVSIQIQTVASANSSPPSL